MTDLITIFVESTVNWNEESFTFLIQAYEQLIDEFIIQFNGGNDDKLVACLLLILVKLNRLTSLNMIRFLEGEKCSISWELLMQELCKLMNLKDSSIRQLTVEIVGFIVDLFIKSII